jgi:hypothetical protein
LKGKGSILKITANKIKTAGRMKYVYQIWPHPEDTVSPQCRAELKKEEQL